MKDRYYRAREEATLALVHVEEGMWAKEALSYLSDRGDKALSTEIVYGTLQNLLLIDHILSFYLKYPLSKLTPHIRNILRGAIYQLHFLDKVPQKIVVYDSVRLAGRYGHKGVQGLVSGVLNNFLREKRWVLPQETAKRLSLEYSHPQWLVERWLETLGKEETEALLKWNNSRTPLCVRVNTLVNSPKDYAKILEKANIPFAIDTDINQAFYLEKTGSVTELPGFASGSIQPQSKASMLVAYLLEPKPNESILDLCAAPGTKTSHIAEFMKNTGTITAVDISEKRLESAQVNLERLKVTNVSFVAKDARYFQIASQDKILVDAPCSGLGILKNRPDARYQKTKESLEDLPKLQLEILNNAATLLRPGGILVYSTCTLEKRENSKVIEQFLLKHNEFYEEEIKGITGLTREKRGYQSYPHKTHTDGFYYCRLRKRAKS